MISQALAQGTTGVPISYQLPTTGTLPQTYMVTLAIVQQDNPNWIISQFLRGEPRTVTAANAGKFTEKWDGLDENLMPVPPGTYAVKGIYMPAKKWQVDGEYHAVVPQFVAGASSWMPSREQWQVPEPFGGDPCGAPLGDVDVGPNGVAVFYYVYLENGLNNPLVDLTKPAGLGQFVRAFPSGGAGGGSSTCTAGSRQKKHAAFRTPGPGRKPAPGMPRRPARLRHVLDRGSRRDRPRLAQEGGLALAGDAAHPADTHRVGRLSLL
jgi:hypothetical protein